MISFSSVAEWARQTEPLAYELGIRPREFEGMQPGEFWLVLEAHVRRQKEQDRRAAYFVSILMAPYMKEGTHIDVEDIVAPLWGETEELKQKRALERRKKQESDRQVLETEFAWALRSK